MQRSNEVAASMVDGPQIDRYIKASLITIMLKNNPTLQAVDVQEILTNNNNGLKETDIQLYTKYIREQTTVALGKQFFTPGSFAKNHLEAQLKDIQSIFFVDLQGDIAQQFAMLRDDAETIRDMYVKNKHLHSISEEDRINFRLRFVVPESMLASAIEPKDEEEEYNSGIGKEGAYSAPTIVHGDIDPIAATRMRLLDDQEGFVPADSKDLSAIEAFKAAEIDTFVTENSTPKAHKYYFTNLDDAELMMLIEAMEEADSSAGVPMVPQYEAQQVGSAGSAATSNNAAKEDPQLKYDRLGQ